MKAIIIILTAAILPCSFAGTLQVELRDRDGKESVDGGFQLRSEQWQGGQTAVIVCDMWDSHHCHNAVKRVKELVPRVNLFLEKVRSEGGLVIHAPSSCMNFYRDHPSRLRAQKVPRSTNLPADINSWVDWIDEQEKRSGYPVDHSDGGEDDDPVEHALWIKELKAMGRNPQSPWLRQIKSIKIDQARDFISDNGEECWNVLEANGIKNVILLGVHTNMCVLGRPFGLRQLARNGKNVVLVRDLTDSMYNPSQHPRVSHFAGTELIVAHIEEHVCPTISSEQLLGGNSFVFKGDARPKILFVIGEREYQTRESLSAFAASHLTQRYRCEFIVAGDEENDFSGIIESLKDTDAVFFSVRRRSPPVKQLEAIEKFIKSGKPVLGIRTSSHAFSLRGKAAPPGHHTWERFDPDVFGGNYNNHHGNKLATFAKSTAPGHPVLKGLGVTEFSTGGSLYRVLPLAQGTKVLMEGRAVGVDQRQPVAWTYETKWGGRSFYTSLGHIKDFKSDEFKRMLSNAIAWALGAEGNGKSAAIRRAPGIKVPGDLEIDLVLSEPLVQQPLHMSFDKRGRLWVVQYIQYPDPAGLVELSRDKVWRVGYDRVPPPPPHAPGSKFRGRDKITIHEDIDGDGVYDHHKVFADGLNLATSVAHGRGGVWVSNPPYLLFYRDQDGDDVPDGPPEVHLNGFGLEDTHSIANSLVYAPDGWLYGAQGSTVSASIIRPGIDSQEQAVQSMGQNIWRYHPERRVYEIYAEGGGNAFGVEVDSRGRIYSGHNGGDTRGFHYVQGAYYRKSWGKHGALTNPHAYGYFPAMKNIAVERFTHQFIIYEEMALPERYQGRLWGVDVLHSNVVMSEISPNGSTFQTRDIERVVQAADPWFRPVMITPAPDGSLYIADWHDRQVNHYRNHEGDIDHEKGRIYRVRPKGKAFSRPVNVAGMSSVKLIAKLDNPSRWLRRMALRELQDRATVDPLVRGLIFQEVVKRGGKRMKLRHVVDVEFALMAGNDLLECVISDPGVRGYAIQRHAESAKIKDSLNRLVSIAGSEESAEVLGQLAGAARRTNTRIALGVAESIARRDAFHGDPHLPLLVWWILEQESMKAPESVLKLFSYKDFWERAMVKEYLVARMMRRFASEGTQQGYKYCERLLTMAPENKSKEKLMSGFAEAVKGAQLGLLPEGLKQEMRKIPELLSVALTLRLRLPGAVDAAMVALGGNALQDAERVEVISTLGEVLPRKALPVLIGILDGKSSDNVKVAAVGALRGYELDDGVVESLINCIKEGSPSLRDAAADYMSGKREVALRFLHRVASGDVPSSVINSVMAEKLRVYKDAEIEGLIKTIRGKGSKVGVVDGSEVEIARVKNVLAGSPGNPKRGEAIFLQRCGSCHLMFGTGGVIGPDLTSYQRGDEGSLLLSIISPSAEIREGFENVVLMMSSGEVHSGFRTEENERVVFLRELSGAVRSISKDGVKSITYSPVSLMPQGLLNGLKDQQLQDIFAYLRSTTPPF
ncbi:MAG: isochorismatase family protein [Verrucomicrobiaceae bacterium]|nr:isochorismatase family protein [Verrucomicrobiaceae bacterium]